MAMVSSDADFGREYNTGIRCCRDDVPVLQLFSPSRRAIKWSRAGRKPERKCERVEPRATINVGMRSAARDSMIRRKLATHCIAAVEATMSKVIDYRVNLSLTLDRLNNDDFGINTISNPDNEVLYFLCDLRE